MQRSGLRLVDLMVLAAISLTAGCAGMINGRRHWIPVTSSPPGATVFVDGVDQGTTPLALVLVRKPRRPVIRIESLGYDPVEIRMGRTTAGFALFGNILFGVVPGIYPALSYSLNHDGKGFFPILLLWAGAFGALFTAIDTGTGSINEFTPKEIAVTLKKSDGTPKVESILLDAQGFRNIKWIRIRAD